MCYGYVYLITNKINGHKYVGMRASNVFDENYWGSGILITKAIKKYGKENFTREILHWCNTPDELIMTEVAELKKRNAAKSDEYYNIIDDSTPILFGSKNGFYGKNHTDSTKKIISEKNSGIKLTSKDKEKRKVFWNSEDGNNLKEKLSIERKGKCLSDEHRLAIKNSFTDVRRKQISENTKKFFLSEDGIKLRQELASAAKERFTGVEKTEEHKKNISVVLKGMKHSWQDKINKNPEKIRKTAEKHTGMKRTDEAKKNMSNAKKGKSPNNKGKKYYYNPANPLEKILCFESEAPQGWINGIYNKSKV